MASLSIASQTTAIKNAQTRIATKVPKRSKHHREIEIPKDVPRTDEKIVITFAQVRGPRGQARIPAKVQAQLPQHPQTHLDRQSDAVHQTPPNPHKGRATKEAPKEASLVSRFVKVFFGFWAEIARGCADIAKNAASSASCLYRLLSGAENTDQKPVQQNVKPSSQKTPESRVASGKPLPSSQENIRVSQYEKNKAWAQQTKERALNNRAFHSSHSEYRARCVLAASSRDLEVGETWQSRMQGELPKSRKERVSELDAEIEGHNKTMEACDRVLDQTPTLANQNDQLDAAKLRVNVQEQIQSKRDQKLFMPVDPRSQQHMFQEGDRYFLMLSEKGARLSELNTPASDAAVLDVRSGEIFKASEFTEQTGIKLS